MGVSPTTDIVSFMTGTYSIWLNLYVGIVNGVIDAIGKVIPFKLHILTTGYGDVLSLGRKLPFPVQSDLGRNALSCMEGIYWQPSPMSSLFASKLWEDSGVL